ncbi:N-acetylmuramoyl-L-alanine amidase [Candidatus Dependentiae bacterium]|nr:N-acetylmuramoyl-L-alanine amidase [Candidatus Dependentiae bacterium]
MNTYFKKIIILCVLLSSRSVYSINSLKYVEICNKRLAPQLFFEFTNSLYFEKRIDAEKMQLEISFPAMNIQDFKEKNVVESIKSLGDIIKKAELFYSQAPSPRVVILITFSTDDILIRWNKLEDPARLLIDFFKKSDLQKLQEQGKQLLYAKNKSNDFDNKLIDCKNSELQKKNRILVDAGHGGQDTGALGFFLLKEKELTLDIARRVQLLLKKKGFEVYLTRAEDKFLSLKDRTDLATQLKADFFVSIHANAVPSVSNASGIESYFLNSNDILARDRRGGFLFVFNENDETIAKLADITLKNNIDQSEQLALSIQNGIIEYLNSKKVSDVIDRGIKRNDFRVLLENDIPAALIEVGFITNPKEAKRLSITAYRQLLAIGISKGIEKYVETSK